MDRPLDVDRAASSGRSRGLAFRANGFIGSDLAESSAQSVLSTPLAPVQRRFVLVADRWNRFE
jgi:hypothetical protein